MAEQRATGGNGSREADRRKTILRAAVEVFAKKGYHGCRIADVAKEAKVAYGLVYHYFKNKDELLQTVFETGWGGFVDRIAGAAGAELPVGEKVRKIAEVAFEAYRVDPQAVRVLILEIARSPSALGRQHRDHAFVEVVKIVHQMFLAAEKQGELKPGTDPLLCATMLFGAIEMGLTALVAGLYGANDEQALDRAKSQIAEAFLFGVLPAAEELEWKREKSGTKLKAARRA